MCGTFEVAEHIGICIEASEAAAKLSTPAECDLVRRPHDGHEMAYREFVERYQSPVYRVAYGILANRQGADEVAQKVFVRAHSSLTDFDGRGSLFTLVFRIVVNECYVFMRQKGKKVLNNSDSAEVQVIRDPYPTPNRGTSRRGFLNELLDQIPEEDRYLLLLRELEGYSVAQLAEATGKDEDTIRVTLFRTRQRLSKAAAQLSLDAGRARHKTY
jgi:RNA polymerase sigma-70 factor, ECF subfamily